MEKTKDLCGEETKKISIIFIIRRLLYYIYTGDVGLDGELHRSCMGGSSAVALLISQDTIITYWQYFVVGAAGAFGERGSKAA